MDTKLRIITYNCQSFRSNKSVVKKLLEQSDILLIQETLLTDCNANELETVTDDRFIVEHRAAEHNGSFLTGRPSGGLAIYWKAIDNFTCKPVMYTSRIMGLVLENPTYRMVIFNVYLNCDYRTLDSLHDYQTSIGNIANFIREESFDDIVLAGDFNCDPSKGRFFREFSKMLSEHSLVKADIDNLPRTSYTFVSPNAIASTSWLDHVVCSNEHLASNFKILYGTTLVDHIPLYFELNLPNTPMFHASELNMDEYPDINWDITTDFQLELYNEIMEDLAVELWAEALSCDELECNTELHKTQLNYLYNALIDCIHFASEHLPKVKKRNKKRVVGWNKYCSNLYADARIKFLRWHGNGRIRSGHEFEDMKRSRSSFKNALKFCKNNELRLRKELLLSKFKSNNSKSFYKEVRKIKGTVTNSRCIDGTCDTNEIVNIFNEKYKSILDNPQCQATHTVPRPRSNVSPLRFTLPELDMAISRLNPGRGADFVHVTQLKNAGPCFRNLLCKLMNKFISHSFLPRNILGGLVQQIINAEIHCMK